MVSSNIISRARSYLAAGLIAAISLTGCASMERAQRDVEAISRRAVSATGQDMRQTPARQGAADRGVWIVGDPVYPDARRELPRAFSSEFVFAEELPSRLPAIVELINSRTRIAVKATEDALSYASRTDESPRMDVIGLLGSEYTPPRTTAGAQAGQANQAAGRGAVFRYQGTLAGFLDTVAARFGISWRYEENEIVLYRLESRVLTVHALASDEVDMDISVRQETTPGSQGTAGSAASTAGSAGGTSGGMGGGVVVGGAPRSGNTDRLTTRNEAGVRTKIKVWDEIKENVERMLSSDGKVAVSQGLATVTVTDVPERVSAVARYIEQENARLARQVVIDFAIYAVEINREDGYGLDWQSVFRVLQENYGFSIATAAGAAVRSANQIATGVVVDNPNSATGAADTVGRNRAYFRALSTQGSVAVVHSTTLTAPNGQPAIVRNAKERDYVSGFTVQSVAGNTLTGNTSERIVTPQVQTAVDSFTLTAMPRVLDGRRVMLQFSLSIEELQAFRQAESQFGSFDLRDVNRKNLLQRVNLRSGQTLMIASVEQDQARDTRAGTLDPAFPLLGGGRDTRRGRTVFVLVMTPHVGDTQ